MVNKGKFYERKTKNVIPIYRMMGIHIEITNACNLECSNCTRHIGHHKKPFMMDLETVERAILSLVTPFNAEWQNFPEGFPGFIGIMGGEPTSHPKLVEICKLMQKHVPREKRQFWTDGYRYEKYQSVIENTFELGNIHINRHDEAEVGWHQPLLIASAEVIDDKALWERLIGDCWVQSRWFASITPKGGFFCEVAASLSHLFDGPMGYPIEPGWWAKNPTDFWDMRDEYCSKCSAAIPMPAVMANNRDPECNFDLVSPDNLKRLMDAGSPRVKSGKAVVFDGKIDAASVNVQRPYWRPWRHDPNQTYVDGVKELNQYRPPVFKRVGNLVQISE